MLLENFNHTIDTWINGLPTYNFSQLCKQPSPGKWSLGQLYLHLIRDTQFYLEQIRLCTMSNDHSTEEPVPFAKTLFAKNDFPDAMIEGGPSNAFIPQPDSKDQLMNGLLDLKEEMKQAYQLILNSAFIGKTHHPGLGYFSAEEWFRFAEIHFRHHLRQKKRIDTFLDINK